LATQLQPVKASDSTPWIRPSLTHGDEWALFTGLP